MKRRVKGFIVIMIFNIGLIKGQNANNITLGTVSNTENIIIWTGQLLSEKYNEPIVGASIIATDGISAVTDVDGNFEMSLKSGNYNFNFSALGFRDRQILVEARSSDFSRITLEEEALLLDEVVIGAQNDRQRITEITPGLQRLSVQELEGQSKFFGEVDVLRSLQSISGVHNAGEGASGFNVRGGNADQNLILQDGHLIFNPSHALGFFSLFHPDLIQYVDLYKGGIPVKYGGRLSSVLSVKTRRGDEKKFKLKGGVGVISSRLSAEGPIIKDKVSFIVGGRYSYADWIFNIVDNPDVNNSKALFNDITANVDGRITPTTSIGVSVLRSKDDFRFAEEARYDYSTTSGEAYVKQLIGDKINLSLNVNKGRYTSSLFDLKGNDQSKFTNKIDYTRARIDLLFAVLENFQINAGSELIDYKVSPGEVIPLITESIITPQELAQERGRELSGYIEGQWTQLSNFDISAGIRITSYKSLGPDQVFLYPEGEFKTPNNVTSAISYDDGETITSFSGLEPRLSLRYEINKKASVKTAFSRTYQYLTQISNTASATPIDIWQLSNDHIAPQYSDNFSLGYFRNFKDDTYQSSIELFYRKANDITDYKDFAKLLLNEQIETDLVTGTGRSYGVELNLSKKIGKVRGNMSYTYSISERQVIATAIQPGINNGSWYPSNYDIPHVVNLNIVKSWAKSNIAFNFTYRSGRPTTAPVSSYANQNVLNIPIYSDRNKFRVPTFHRLDVSYTIGPWGKKEGLWNHSITLSVYNLYLRKNAYSVYFRQNPFESVKAIRVATLGTIFPSITYNFNLK